MGAPGSCRVAADEDAVFLDDGVREELLAHLLHAPLRLDGILRVEVELDGLAEAGVLHLTEAQRAQRPRDRLPLRVEHRLLQRDDDARSHPAASSKARTLMRRGRAFKTW